MKIMGKKATELTVRDGVLLLFYWIYILPELLKITWCLFFIYLLIRVMIWLAS